MSVAVLERNIVHPVTKKTLGLFVEKVRAHEGENLSKIILFGSVARGEANEDSDIDVLVILRERTLQKRKDISGISADVKFEMNFDINAYLQALCISKEESQGLNFHELMLNVQKEGIILHDEQHRA